MDSNLISYHLPKLDEGADKNWIQFEEIKYFKSWSMESKFTILKQKSFDEKYN